MSDTPSICVYGHRKHERVGAAFRGIATHTIGSFDLVYVEEPGPQPQNVNRALSRASGRYVCLHDNDAEPLEDDWLGRLIRTLEENPTIGLLAPIQIQSHAIHEIWQSDRSEVERRKADQFPTRFVDALNVPTTVVVFDRERTPGIHFDEEVPGTINGSDIDFCLQVHRQGFRVCLDTSVVFLHPEKTSAEDRLYDRGLATWEDEVAMSGVQSSYLQRKWGSLLAERADVLQRLHDLGSPHAHVCGLECHPERFRGPCRPN